MEHDAERYISFGWMKSISLSALSKVLKQQRSNGHAASGRAQQSDLSWLLSKDNMNQNVPPVHMQTTPPYTVITCLSLKPVAATPGFYI